VARRCVVRQATIGWRPSPQADKFFLQREKKLPAWRLAALDWAPLCAARQGGHSAAGRQAARHRILSQATSSSQEAPLV